MKPEALVPTINAAIGIKMKARRIAAAARVPACQARFRRLKEGLTGSAERWLSEEENQTRRAPFDRPARSQARSTPRPTWGAERPSPRRSDTPQRHSARPEWRSRWHR